MAADMRQPENQIWKWFRTAMWSGALFLFLLPAVAMQFTNEVNWTGGDFIFAAVLLFGAAGIIELAARSTSSLAYRAAVVLAVAVSFLIVWTNAAVGMIGDEDNPYNIWFIGVIALALLGAVAAGFRARGMALAMILAAGAQVIAGAIGIASDPRGGIISTAFAGLWILSAALFRKAAQDAAGTRS